MAFLFDCCPADFRAYAVLRRHPLVLARFAVEFVEGQRKAAQDGLAGVRASLNRQVSQEVIEAAAQAWLEQSARLARARRAVGLIEDALRGKVFVPKL
jgi:hypothetical protein